MELLASAIGCCDLLIGAAWLLLSRAAIHLQFREPIVLLTAVHFHYSGFATSHLLAALVKARGNNSSFSRIIAPMLPMLLIAPFFIAAGLCVLAVIEDRRGDSIFDKRGFSCRKPISNQHEV